LKVSPPLRVRGYCHQADRRLNEIGIAVLGSCRLQHKEEKIIDRASFAIVGDDIGKETNARSIQFC
jgi:hypothetical protein